MSPAVATDEIAPLIRVPLGAVGSFSLCLAAVAATSILRIGHGLQVSPEHAPAIPTQVVQLKTERDRTDIKLIADPVRHLGLL